MSESYLVKGSPSFMVILSSGIRVPGAHSLIVFFNVTIP